ncbi:cupin domain-containing protein [Nocardia veterana]|uniref:Cupin domain-containing protein n=1 Tax=Nocardia veterana TaxID=132249 RepID=A0A7X6M054_9NOCA|nr:cupin domain-containing protein [Nocardia veterana]
MRRWTLVLRPGEELDYETGDWADALVVVAAGELELECRSGRRVRFAAGAVLAPSAVPVRRLFNPGPGPLILAAVTRRRR